MLNTVGVLLEVAVVARDFNPHKLGYLAPRMVKYIHLVDLFSDISLLYIYSYMSIYSRN